MTRVADSKLIAAMVKMLLNFCLVNIYSDQIEVMYVGRS